MYLVVNHYCPAPTDLSIASTVCSVPAASLDHLGRTVPGFAYATAEHIALVQAFSASDYRRQRLAGFELVDLGNVNALGAFSLAAQAARDAALASRKVG